MDVHRWRRRIEPRRLGSVVVISIAACVVGLLVLRIANGGSSVDTWWFGNAVMAVGLGSVGLLLTRRVPGNPIGWWFLVGAASQAVLGVGREWAVYAEVGRHAVPGAVLAAWLGTWPIVPALVTFPIIVLLFPDGTLPSRRWRPVIWAVVGFGVAGAVRLATSPGRFTDEMPGLVNPIGVDWRPLDVAGAVSGIGFAITVVLAIVSLFVRTRRADPVVRQQLKWVAFAGAVLAFELLLEILPWPSDPGFITWTGPLALTLFVASIAFAVLRYRLWDIDLIITSSVVFAVLTSVVALVYLGVVASVSRVADREIEIGPSLLAAAVAVAVVAVLRDRIQRVVERLLYGDRRDPYRALSSLGKRLDRPGSSDAVLDEVVDAVARSLRLEHVALVADGDGVVASIGSARSTMYEVPLMFRDTEVGVLVVSPRVGGRIGPAEKAVLADLARPVAAVLRAVAAGEALQRSRLELVTAREEERRRVRRDLHDGLGPSMAAVRMKLDGARLLIDADPERAKSVLAQLTDEVRDTIDDVRRLVYDLQPPVLDEVGFVSALEERVEAFSGPLEDGGFLTVELEAPPAIDGLSAAIEVAVYRIICEGLTNVARHAHASRCKVTVRVADGLDVLIDDDGIGMGTIGPFARAGLGTTSMEDRAAELGGTCRIRRSPLGGTQVDAHIPVLVPPIGPTDRIVT